MWILLAFSGPVLWALSTHIDKYLVERYFKNSDTAVLMVFTALIGILALPFIWWYKPETLTLPWLNIVVMIISGLLYMWAMLFYLRAIQSEEASVIAPLFQTSTLFTLALGYLILGETLSLTNLAGMGLVIGSVLFLSLNQNFHPRTPKIRVLAQMLLCTFILAFASVIFKFFAVQSDFWSTTFWTFVGEAIFGIGILLVPSYWQQFKKLFAQNKGAMIGINAANELINLGGGLGTRFASLLAPVALVSALSSTTTLFVFFFGVLITLFLPKFGREDLSPANLWQKGISAALVTVGVILINT